MLSDNSARQRTGGAGGAPGTALVTSYRALGWTGTCGQAAVVKARDLNFMRKMQNKQSLRLGMKSNNQKHFKDRNGMCM